VNGELFQRVVAWVGGDPDENDRVTLIALLNDGNEDELVRRFAAPISFGTAGLRGPVMAGPAGMNRFTVRRTTQGVVAWMHDVGIDPARGVVVGRDARHGSEAFNDEVVAVLLGAGARVFEMPRPLPTPLVAYCVKAFGAGAGIMITASHNPPQDNGYKLYGPDGSQIIAPNDEIVEARASDATLPPLGDRSNPLHTFVSEESIAQYRSHFVERFAVEGGSDLKIAYTPLHGVGGETMISMFEEAGYRNVEIVDEQFTPDGTFPTLPFPNPEEPGALDLAIARAEATQSTLVIANDPDADRLGVAAKDDEQWRTLRGDEIGWLLASALLPEMDSPDDVVATSIVSSTMLEAMANDAHVRYVATLTGFKWILRAAGDGVLRFGYEEALGFAVDPMVADKDGMSAALAVCRLAHELSVQGLTLFDRLDEIEGRFGVHAGGQLSIRAEGPDGLTSIRAAVERLREAPPATLGETEVTEVVDLSKGCNGLMATDGVLLRLGTKGRVVVRPSGTEAKLKAYIEITAPTFAGVPISIQRLVAVAQVNEVREVLQNLLKL
jgi:phosphomannomutase